jgi:hypothetical protein
MQRVGIPNRLQGGALDFIPNNSSWRLWLHTNDWIHGTYVEMFPDGSANRVTIRADEGDDVVPIKPKEQ